jgi:RNA polymerase sigma-70 factor (ECF subfamily)
MIPTHELEQRLRAGDAGALADYLERHRPQLLAYIERRLGEALRRKIEPADLIQETAVAALNALPQTDLSDRDPFGWLCQLAEQRIIDASRRFRAGKRSADLEVPLNSPAGADGNREWIGLLAASITSPSSAVARAERHDQLQAAIAELPAETRDVLRWRYVDGLPTKDIAARLGKSDVAVRVMISRSLQRLQQLLADS